MTHELSCTHGAVSIDLALGETLREWRMRLTDAQHRLNTVTGCPCGAGEMAVRALGTALMTPGPERRGGFALRLCREPGCRGVALDQRGGATTGLTCYVHSEMAQRPSRRLTTAGRAVEVR